MKYDLTPNTFHNQFPSNTEQCMELMQYTGLKDKNGKEIYEGDILKVIIKVTPQGKDATGYTYYGAVYFEYGKYVIKFTEKFNLNNELHCWALNHCEVTGNIYKNPELLNKN